MFGLFKKSFKEIGPLRYQMLAVTAVSHASLARRMMSSMAAKKDKETFSLIFKEALSFMTCLAQMRIQKKYKLDDAYDIVTIIQELQQQFEQLPLPQRILRGKVNDITKSTLNEAIEGQFFEMVVFYAGRSYVELGISEEEIEEFCKITRQFPKVIKGAGWTMALLIFQIRSSKLLLNEFVAEERLPPMLMVAREVCLLNDEEL